jgi:Flp pilus assembly protein TadG
MLRCSEQIQVVTGGKLVLALRNNSMTRLAPKTRPRLSARRRGQALLELAFIMPILALLLLGVFDIGRVFADQESVTNAAMQGAKWKSLHTDATDTTVKSKVTQELNGAVAVNPNNIQIALDDVNAKVTVSVSYQHDILFGLLQRFGTQLNLSASAAMPYYP